MGAHLSGQPGRPLLFARHLPQPPTPRGLLSREPALDVTMGGKGSRCLGLGTVGRDTGRWLSRSHNAQPCGRDPCPQPSGRAAVGGAALWGAAAIACQVQLRVILQWRWGLPGGSEEDGESCCAGEGGKGCRFLIPSQPVQDTLVSQR